MLPRKDREWPQAPLEFMLPKVDWKPTPVSELPSWKGASRISIDVETYDPQLSTLGPGVRRGGYVCGIGFQIEDGPGYYLPIRHSEDNLDEETVWRYIRDQAKEFTGHVVGAGLSYDFDWLYEHGVVFPKAKNPLDIQIAEPLIDEHQDSYSLDSIAQRRGLPGKDETILQEAMRGYGIKKGEMALLPGRFVSAYAMQDLRLPLIIMRRQERDIEEQNLHQIFDLESKLIQVLVRMRRRGVLIDQDQLAKVEQWSIAEEKKALKIVEDFTGYALGLGDVNKAKALVHPLRRIGVDVGVTATGLPSVDKDLLGRIDHPVAKALLRARQVNKLRGTFVNSIREHMVNGRIHCTFNQLRKTSDDDDAEGARYGRLSSCNPNLQQQPGRDPEIGPLWRSIYIPEPGMKWAALDYSQQEPRWTVHYAEACASMWESEYDPTGIKRLAAEKAREAAHRYRTDPNTDNHTLMAQMIAGQGPDWQPSKKERSDAKLVFLGLAYGMGGPRLARYLGLPTEWKFVERLGKTIEVAGPEAQALFERFHAGVPFIRQLSYTCQDRVGERGYITTVLGRRCRFPKKPEDQRRDARDVYDWLHKALNRLIQGSSADQTKLALYQIDQAGHEPQLQVHDEIDLSVRDEKHAEEVADIMRHCIPMRVPAKVDVEIGNSWGDSM